MTQVDDPQTDERAASAPPPAPPSGVKVYDRPARALSPAWILVLVALLIVAGSWLLFTYVF